MADLKQKVAAVATAATLAAGAAPIMAQASTGTYPDEALTTGKPIVESPALKSLYQDQMSSIVLTIEKLKEFYEQYDKDDVIKSAYPEAYALINANIGSNYISYGGPSAREYIPQTSNYVEEIQNNNNIVATLNIYHTGARDTDYGMIRDKNTGEYRLKTEEERQLISNYTQIYKNAKYIDSQVLTLAAGMQNGTLTNEQLLSGLQRMYFHQNEYIYNTRNKLRVFYETYDTQDIIKNGYAAAYQAFVQDLNDTEIFMDESKDMTEILMTLINRNEKIISDFVIKPAGNGRDPETGIIIDPNSELGFRAKTEEDKQLINLYSDCVGLSKTYPYDFLVALNNAVENNLNQGYGSR